MVSWLSVRVFVWQALVVQVGARECLFTVDACDGEAVRLQHIIERSGMMLTDTKRTLFHTKCESAGMHRFMPFVFVQILLVSNVALARIWMYVFLNEFLNVFSNVFLDVFLNAWMHVCISETFSRIFVGC